MRNIGVSILKILCFIVFWAALTTGVIMSAIAFSGEGFYAIREVRIGVEIGGTFAVLIPLIVMAKFIDKRSLATIGFGPRALSTSSLARSLVQRFLLCLLEFWSRLAQRRLSRTWSRLRALH